jgi:hypothetical protein
MGGFAENISKNVRKDLSHHLIYPPGTPLRFGDIVERSAGVWVPVGNLADQLGLDVEVTEDTKPSNWFPYASREAVIEPKIAGQTGPTFRFLTQAEAGVKVTLKGENAFALSMTGVRIERIKDIDVFWKQVREKRGFWTWDLRRRIVTKLVRTETATFLASGRQEMSFELEASAGVNVGATQVADLAAGFTLRSTMSGRDNFVSESESTPLFGAHKVGFFGDLGIAEWEDDPDATLSDSTLNLSDEE